MIAQNLIRLARGAVCGEVCHNTTQCSVFRNRDRNGRLRTVRALRGIDSKVTLNKALWGLAEQVIQGSEPTPTVSLSV